MIAAALLLGQVPVLQPPRLRTRLDSGAVLLVEPLPGSGRVEAELWFSAADAPEGYRTHGYRHLLEHLAARRDGSLDRRIETAGGLLTARTYRAATAFRVVLPAGETALLFEAVRELAAPFSTTLEAIAVEARAIREEDALRTPAERASSVLWERAYGQGGLDPMGAPDVIAAATPADLLPVWRALACAPRAVLVVRGEVDLDAATVSARRALDRLPPTPSPLPKPAPREAAPPEWDGTGVATAVRVGSAREARTLAVLAAALGLASETPGGYVAYTPSDGPGLVVAGTTEGALPADPARADAAFGRARELLRTWLKRGRRDPFTRGLLLSQSPDLRPEGLEDGIVGVTPERFREAWALFARGGDARVGG